MYEQLHNKPNRITFRLFFDDTVANDPVQEHVLCDTTLPLVTIPGSVYEFIAEVAKSGRGGGVDDDTQPNNSAIIPSHMRGRQLLKTSLSQRNSQPVYSLEVLARNHQAPNLPCGRRNTSVKPTDGQAMRPRNMSTTTPNDSNGTGYGFVHTRDLLVSTTYTSDRTRRTKTDNNIAQSN